MFDELEIYKNNGHFFLGKGKNLKELTKNVPDLPGVYVIYKLTGRNVQLVYIGKSGTMQQNGEFKAQGLRGRLNNKQEGMKRQDFFDKKCEQENIDALDIYWYVSFDKNTEHLPEFIEGLLLQRHYEVYGFLPEWNKDY